MSVNYNPKEEKSEAKPLEKVQNYLADKRNGATVQDILIGWVAFLTVIAGLIRGFSPYLVSPLILIIVGDFLRFRLKSAQPKEPAIYKTNERQEHRN